MAFAEEQLQPYFAIDFLNNFAACQFILPQGSLVSSLPAAQATGLHSDIWQFTEGLATRFVLSHSYHRPFGHAMQLACSACGCLRSTKKPSVGGRPNNPTSFTFTCRIKGCSKRSLLIRKPSDLHLIEDTVGKDDTLWYRSDYQWDDYIKQAKSVAE